MSMVKENYELAKEFTKIRVETEEAISKLKDIKISLHCCRVMM